MVHFLGDMKYRRFPVYLFYLSVIVELQSIVIGN
jgi:hypothetical protein